jgi:putative chitobiose transport system permease protein
MKRRPTWMTVLLYTLASVMAVVALGPALYLLLVALRSPADESWTLANFVGAWQAGSGLARPFVNSLIVTAALLVLNLTLASLAAYPLARMRFPGRDVIFVVILATLMIPEQVTVIPIFKTIVGLGLYDSLAGLVLPLSVNAFGIFLIRQAYLAVPAELEEAALLDGCNSLQTWWHVMLPLAKPALATLAAFVFIGSWSNFLWPLIVLQSESTYTLPVALNMLLGVYSTNARFAYAASVLAMLPVIAMYIVMQRWLAKGLLTGAIKG